VEPGELGQRITALEVYNAKITATDSTYSATANSGWTSGGYYFVKPTTPREKEDVSGVTELRDLYKEYTAADSPREKFEIGTKFNKAAGTICEQITDVPLEPAVNQAEFEAYINLLKSGPQKKDLLEQQASNPECKASCQQLLETEIAAEKYQKGKKDEYEVSVVSKDPTIAQLNIQAVNAREFNSHNFGYCDQIDVDAIQAQVNKQTETIFDLTEKVEKADTLTM
jgi:hypothetical protein